ncbi:MAG: sigma-70 family RNA polymerase sigma factor [Nanoarchaeota archaeon]|nr:sigma-70 family RNA polymerase sigma factor [Nanoarchaeota archaeon]
MIVKANETDLDELEDVGIRTDLDFLREGNVDNSDNEPKSCPDYESLSLEELSLRYQAGDERALEFLLSSNESYIRSVARREAAARRKHYSNDQGYFVIFQEDDIHAVVVNAVEKTARELNPNKGCFKTRLNYRIKGEISEWKVRMGKGWCRRYQIRTQSIYKKDEKERRDLPYSPPQLEEIEEREHTNHNIRKVFQRLSKREKQITYLRYCEGINLREIGKIVGLTKSRLGQILEELNPILAKRVQELDISPNARIFISALRDWYLERGKTEIFKDTEEFPEQTIAGLIIAYRNGDMDALGEIYRLTENHRIQIADIKQCLLPRYVHRMDIETGITDAMIQFADNFDFEEYSQKGDLQKYFYKTAHKNCMNWVYQTYPWLRRKLYAERITPSEAIGDPSVADPLEEVIEKEYAEKTLEKILNGVGERDREIFRQNIFLGKPAYKTAEDVKITERDYYRAMNRVRRRLLEGMGEELEKINESLSGLNMAYVGNAVTNYFQSKRTTKVEGAIKIA